MSKMKQFGIKSAWLLAAGAIFALSVTILNSCSSDEDYDMYMGDELRTHAAATSSAAPEPGGGTNNRDDPAGYTNDVDNCGGVVLSQLHCESKTDQCDTYTMAYYHVKQLAGGSCSNMTPEKIIEVAGKLSGVSLSAYYTIGENSDTAAFYLKKFDSLSKKIIIYESTCKSGI